MSFSLTTRKLYQIGLLTLCVLCIIAWTPIHEETKPSMWRCPDSASTAMAAYVADESNNTFSQARDSCARQIKPENRICFASREVALAFDYIPRAEPKEVCKLDAQFWRIYNYEEGYPDPNDLTTCDSSRFANDHPLLLQWYPDRNQGWLDAQRPMNPYTGYHGDRDAEGDFVPLHWDEESGTYIPGPPTHWEDDGPWCY